MRAQLHTSLHQALSAGAEGFHGASWAAPPFPHWGRSVAGSAQGKRCPLEGKALCVPLEEAGHSRLGPLGGLWAMFLWWLGQNSRRQRPKGGNFHQAGAQAQDRMVIWVGDAIGSPDGAAPSVRSIPSGMSEEARGSDWACQPFVGGSKPGIESGFSWRHPIVALDPFFSSGGWEPPQAPCRGRALCPEGDPSPTGSRPAVYNWFLPPCIKGPSPLVS